MPRNTWQTGCTGNEVPFLHNGEQWLYVWNPALKKHGYLHLPTDTVYAGYRDGERYHV